MYVMRVRAFMSRASDFLPFLDKDMNVCVCTRDLSVCVCIIVCSVMWAAMLLSRCGRGYACVYICRRSKECLGCECMYILACVCILGHSSSFLPHNISVCMYLCMYACWNMLTNRMYKRPCLC